MRWPSIDLYLEDCYRLSRKFRAGRLRPGDPEWEKFCSVFGLTHLTGFSAGLATATATVSLTIAADTNNYNLFTAAGSPSYPVVVNCTINSGVIVGSTSTGSYSFDTGSGWASGSQLTLKNNGKINGKGGTPGNGGNGPTASNGTSGSQGGPALLVRRAISIDNGSGQINGGGGGGGGGGGAIGSPDNKSSLSAGGGGGGAGRGTTNTSGGTGGTGNSPGANGGMGSDSGAGGGGAGGSNTYATGGTGGAGGGFGSAGSNGGNGSYSLAFGSFGIGGPAGPAGVAVNGDSLVNWIALGTINGARTG